MQQENVVEQAVSGALAATKDETPEVKAAAVGAAAGSAAAISPPPAPVVGKLWLILISGLVVAVIGSLIGVIWVVADGKESTSPDVIVTIFTTTLAGLIGLFVKSPTQSG